MGNLNQFYVMGRVVRPPQVEEVDERSVVHLAIAPGTGSRAPRGGIDPLAFEAHGPQVEAAKSLAVGTPVLLRGQLRQEPRGEGPAQLVARVQAIELLAEGGGPPHPVGEDGALAPSGRRRRRRRRRGERRPGDERQGEAPAGEGSGAEAAPPAAPAPDPAADLPPPTPIAPRDAAPKEPLPDSTPDMPF